MMPDKAKQLIDKYPRLFRHLSHLECGEGWLQLLDEVCDLIDWHIQSLPVELQEDVYATQIKEKFASVRIYFNQETPYITGVIAMAEIISARTCEHCGQPGVRRGGSWIRTLCEADHQKQKLVDEESKRKYLEWANKDKEIT